MTNVNAYDIISAAVNQKPEDMANAFADMTSQAIADRIDAKREEMAQNLLNGPDDIDNESLDNLSDEEIEDFLSTLTPEELEELEKEIDSGE